MELAEQCNHTLTLEKTDMVANYSEQIAKLEKQIQLLILEKKDWDKERLELTENVRMIEKTDAHQKEV